jgi:hypothetical protein
MRVPQFIQPPFPFRARSASSWVSRFGPLAWHLDTPLKARRDFSESRPSPACRTGNGVALGYRASYPVLVYLTQAAFLLPQTGSWRACCGSVGAVSRVNPI